MLAVEAEQHARHPFGRQVRPDFLEAVAYWSAQRHPYRPTPLRPQQVIVLLYFSKQSILLCFVLQRFHCDTLSIKTQSFNKFYA